MLIADGIGGHAQNVQSKGVGNFWLLSNCMVGPEVVMGMDMNEGMCAVLGYLFCVSGW